MRRYDHVHRRAIENIYKSEIVTLLRAMAISFIELETLRRLRKLSVRQLIYLVELWRHGGFGKAARALGISQPTLSHQIAQLEQDLQVQLVDRSTRRMVFTDAGGLLLKSSEKALAILTEAIDAVSDLRTERPVAIGIPTYTAYPVVADVIRTFRDRVPDHPPHLIEVPAEEMSQLLNDGELDAGFMTLPTPARISDQMRSLLVWEAPLLFCLPRSHRFAQLPALLPKHVAQLEFILIPRDYHRTHYDYQVSCLRSLGVEPRLVRSEVSNIQSQMALTSAGMGVCLLSADTVPLPADLILLPSNPELGRHRLCLFWNEATDSPHLKLLRQVAGNARRFPS